MARGKKAITEINDIAEAKKAFKDSAEKPKAKKTTKAKAEKATTPEVEAVTETVTEVVEAEQKTYSEAEVLNEIYAEEATVADEVVDGETQTTTVEKEDELDAVKSQNAELLKQLEELKQQITTLQTTPVMPQIIQVSADVEKVQFLWMGEVADDNQMIFGEGGMYGKIIGKTGTFTVPKSELSRILDGLNKRFLDKRWLIIVDGLNEDEREALGVNYKEGELLDKKAFAKMVDLGDELLNIYPKLCDGHKEMVAKRYYEAWKAKNPNITRERTRELNRLCKASGGESNSFAVVLQEMNESDVD